MFGQGRTLSQFCPDQAISGRENGNDGLFARHGRLPTMPEAMSWEEEARCNDHDPEMFFATRSRAEGRAKAICSRCPVSFECLQFALAARVEFGVWGGLSSKERMVLLREAPRPTRSRRLQPAFSG
jgi:WhiB family redox-sensing transcriptional regulator